MGQDEVVNLLKKERKFLTAKQISRKLNCTSSSLNKQLQSLVKFKKVEVKPRKINVGGVAYKRKVNHFRYKQMRGRK